MPDRKPIYAISGPTASGKTALGVELALHFGGEVINFDSVQIYRGIEIATAKPTMEERRGVAHHLIDYVDPKTSTPHLFRKGKRQFIVHRRGVTVQKRLAFVR